MLRHSRPPYVPVNAHYVNPPGTQPLSPWVMAVVGLVVLAITAAAAFFLVRGFSPAPVGPPPTWTVPSTYGPPPATGSGR